MGSEEAPPAESARPAAQEAETGTETATPVHSGRANMLPGRERRRFGLERLVVRLVATLGIIGIGVALGAILAASSVQGWIIGLVVAAVSVILAALLWSSQQL